jgi:hypothetical protein
MEYDMYKIVCDDLDVKFNYVGSTKNFARRMSQHKFDSHDSKKAHMRIYKIINDHGGWTCWEMIKIETCYCASNLEARKRERIIQEMLNADMNTNRPYRTSDELKEYMTEYNAEHYNNNKAEAKEYYKQYNIDKKDEIAAQKKEYYKKIKERIAARNSLKKYHISNTHQKNDPVI